MNPLSNFLDRFKNFLVSSKQTKELVISKIAAHTRITLQESEVDIKDDIVYVKTHPGTRNAIFMRKKNILEELKVLLGNKAPRDIR